MQEVTFSGYSTRSLIQFAAYHGAEINSLCTSIGIDYQSLLETPDERVDSSLYYALWNKAIEQTQNEHLSLHWGEAFNFAVFGIVGYILVNCRTLGEALEKFSRFTTLFCGGTLTEITVSGAKVFCDCRPPTIDPSSKQGLVGRRCVAESILVCILVGTKALTGETLHLSSVWFEHAPPATIAEYDRIFQTEIKFSMPVNRLIFDAACLDWAVLSRNANLLAIFEPQAEAMLATLNHASYSQKVAEAIAQHLKGELPKIGAIARDLALSSRQLQRLLKTEGTSFQKLLDATRKQMALHHLQAPPHLPHCLSARFLRPHRLQPRLQTLDRQTTPLLPSVRCRSGMTRCLEIKIKKYQQYERS
jgi:Arabinose-binding domain of AraC transcription regulator, N-term